MTSKEPGPRILVVEDETNLAEGIRENLEAEGYRVELAADGARGLERIRSGDFDLVVLDVMLPELDGFAVCESARAEGLDTPILFLTARGSADDRVHGLEVGGDDYLPKPFHLRELLLRVRAIVRRRSWYEEAAATETVLRFGENEFNFRTFHGRAWDGTEHALPEKEAMILKALAERRGEIVSREDLLDRVWGYEVFPSTRVLDGFVVRLRQRFERDPDRPAHFHTERGIGYRFERDAGGRPAGELT